MVFKYLLFSLSGLIIYLFIQRFFDQKKASASTPQQRKPVPSSPPHSEGAASSKPKSKHRYSIAFPPHWQAILEQHVPFYQSLSQIEKNEFETRVQHFLLCCKITGVDVDVDLTDRLLVAASAIIPIFGFPNWEYTNLDEVLLYPDSFNQTFETSGDGRNILGMVGTGYMEGKMILSKPALHHGFSNQSDKKNTAIHEFVHLIDKMDGIIDGVPSVLMQQHYVLPWLDLINQKIEAIAAEQSDINAYGGTSAIEFYAVASEYFFERPKLLQAKHPQLYHMLEQIFDQKMNSRELDQKKLEVGRNSSCPCGSGKKFKHCCGLAS